MADEREESQCVVAPPFAQAAPKPVAVLGRCGAAYEQLRVLHVVTGEQRQPLAVLRGEQGRLLHHIGPVAGGAQVVDHHHAGVAQHVVHIHVGGRGLAQPHQVGQSHFGEVIAQTGSRIGQQRERGVCRAQHHDVARRLCHAHHALPAVFDVAPGTCAEQVHGSQATAVSARIAA